MSPMLLRRPQKPARAGNAVLPLWLGTRGRGGDDEMDLIETEQPLNAAREMEMPEMDGIEGSAENPELQWAQIALSSVSE